MTRPLQEVTILSQDSTDLITQELEEYVVTTELEQILGSFFNNYRKSTLDSVSRTGVWISGGFGSGKTYLLKILSYLLSGKEFGGQKAVSFFENKISDSCVLTDLQASANIHADTVLFNTEPEDQSSPKSKEKRIVSIFIHAFNKMQQLSSTFWIADLERQLISNGVYKDFCSRFKELSGDHWENSRKYFYFEKDNIVTALADTAHISRDAALQWYEKAEKNDTADISAFVHSVRDYIELQSEKSGEKHYVIFLCDEIQSYLTHDSDPLLYLLSIVERLGIECHGQAWVIIASCQSLDSLTVSGPDTVRIRDRFLARYTLSSEHTDELIKKRLLMKTNAAPQQLRLLYADKGIIINNSLIFSPDTPKQHLYTDENDFVNTYPFIPYQFHLLQVILNSFCSNHASDVYLFGSQRSFLALFQNAALRYLDYGEGTLIPFSAFYEPISPFINLSFLYADSDFSNNTGDADSTLLPYDIEVLNVLSMIKYIRDYMPSNLCNITTLMIQSIDFNRAYLEQKVESSLKRLENQQLIIRIGSQFIFQTAEERDMNRQIRNVSIDNGNVINRIGDSLFHTLFNGDKTYHYNHIYDYSFNTIIDNQYPSVRKHVFGIHVLTPAYPITGTTDADLRLLSTQERNIIVLLSKKEALDSIQEMKRSIQIDSYLDAYMRRTSGNSSTSSVESARNEKILESQQRAKRSHELIMESLEKANIFVNGRSMDMDEKGITSRIRHGFKILVDRLYTRQNYITHPILSLDSPYMVLSEDTIQDTDSDPYPSELNHLAVTEMFDLIRYRSLHDSPPSIHELMAQFGGIPYGWRTKDVVGVIRLGEAVYKEENGS